MISPLRLASVMVGLLLAASASASSAPVTLALPGQTQLQLTPGSRATATLHSRTGRAAVALDAPLRTLMMQSSTLIAASTTGFLHGGAPATVLYARVPSNPTRPMGYCGAGQEDYLLLLGIRGQRLVLLDRLLVHSCLQSIESASGMDAPPQAAMTPLPPPWVARFDAGPPGHARARCVRVQQDALVMEDCGQKPAGHPSDD